MIYIIYIKYTCIYFFLARRYIYIYMIPQHLASINEFSSWIVSMSSIPIEALALIGSFNPLLNEFGLSCRRIAAKVTETILWTRTVDEQVHLASLETCGIGTIRFGAFFNQPLHGLNLSCSVEHWNLVSTSINLYRDWICQPLCITLHLEVVSTNLFRGCLSVPTYVGHICFWVSLQTCYSIGMLDERTRTILISKQTWYASVCVHAYIIRIHSGSK